MAFKPVKETNKTKGDEGKVINMCEEKSLFETIGIQYEEKDGLLYPIFAEEVVTEAILVGKYGDLWMEYLKVNHPDRYRHLFRLGKLMKKAEEVNEEAYEMLDSIVAKYLEKHPPIDPNSTMEMWQIREQAKMMAEEIIFHDIVNQFH